MKHITQNQVHRKIEINYFATNNNIPSQVESSVVRHPEVHGGNGFAAATVADLGFAPTLGVGRRQASTETEEVNRGGRGPVCGGRFSSGGFSCGGFGWWGFSCGGFSSGGFSRGREAHSS